MNIPTGLVTFLFTDIEGSTKLSQDFPDTLQSALDRHHSIMQNAIESNSGFVFEIVGDAFCAAFEKAEDAVRAAVDAQRKLFIEKWGDAAIKVRMGIHSGNAEWGEEKYRGYLTLAQTNRLMSAAYGGQILISGEAYILAIEKYIVENPETGALNLLNEISFRDLGERRLKDLVKPVKLYQINSKGLREDFPPLKTMDARLNNLPAQLTSFIGRKDEIQNVKILLRQTRLLTLTGSGGAGKTRLALKVAEDIIDDFASGVWFAELAALQDPSLLLQEIMNIFGLKEESGRSLEDTLYDHLKDKEALLILDNCEHLIEACARLAEKLLSRCPRLKIISTTREALKCNGEQIHRVPSLEVPDTKKEYSPEKLMQYESVRLFIERALSVDVNFRLNNENAQAIAAICCQLDGIPLAIELAAARVKIIPVEKIHERLNDSFNLLTGGKRTALPRQQTLRALIDWSYDLASEKEKIIWRRLSIFTGGWTLDAAEKICSGEKIKKEEVLELSDELTEKSIIIFEREKDRYRMLETLKQYGKEKLNEAGEAEDISNRHLIYFMEVSETAEPELKKSGLYTWLEKLDAEHGNLKSAIEWSIRGGDREKGARLAGALGNFWEIRGHYCTGILLKRIIDKAEDINPSSLGKAFYWIGMLTSNQGNFDQAEKYLEKSLEIRRRLGEKRNVATTLSTLGMISHYMGDSRQSLKFYDESLAMFKDLKDKRGIANSLNNIGNIEFFLWNFDKAERYYKEYLELSRKLDDKIGISTSLYNLGNLENSRGNHENAEKLFQESLEISRVVGEKRGVVSTLGSLGMSAYEQRKYETAQKLLEESLILSQELGEKRAIVYSLSGLGNIAFKQGNFEQAFKYLNDSLAMSQEMGYQIGIADDLSNIGNLELHLNNKARAKNLLKESLSLRLEIEDKLGIAYSIIGLIHILYDNNKFECTALLTGAIDISLKRMGTMLPIDYKEQLEKINNELREKLSPEEYLKNYDEGKSITLERAAEIALSNV